MRLVQLAHRDYIPTMLTLERELIRQQLPLVHADGILNGKFTHSHRRWVHLTTGEMAITVPHQLTHVATGGCRSFSTA
jgi:hypothetical protein